MLPVNQKRLSKAISSSEVVIVTHKSQTKHLSQYAVVIKYKSEFDYAPRLTAKGIGEEAHYIKSIAKNHNIVVVKNPLLAIELCKLNIDEMIPENLYTPVAEILVYVYKRNK